MPLIEERMDWPGAAKLALSVVVNVEEGSEMTIARGDRGVPVALAVATIIQLSCRGEGHVEIDEGDEEGSGRPAGLVIQPLHAAVMQVRMRRVNPERDQHDGGEEDEQLDNPQAPCGKADGRRAAAQHQIGDSQSGQLHQDQHRAGADKDQKDNAQQRA